MAPSSPGNAAKLLLRCKYSPGDIVMLTAAVRDLHRCYPGRFLTDVRTPCPDLWIGNPHLTPLNESDPDTKVIDCHYPLIDHSNQTPQHCLNGFIQYLNKRLNLGIRPTEFRGDIHLSEREVTWYSQVHEYAGADIPFWIVAAGGKYDITIKWWNRERYQAVVDHFRGRIQFVQVGELGNHHPKLDGAIDLRGRTTLRELVRLVYHAQGVLCPVTCLMHLAAAVKTRPERPPARPCVVVAGGREPAHWEAYPDHQFIHTGGALECCTGGGCWKDRTHRLHDGNSRDRKENRCVDTVGDLPRCMAMIEPEEVIRRIETYFQGGQHAYLKGSQVMAAKEGVRRSVRNDFDNAPLNRHNARLAADSFLSQMPEYPGGHQGRGIVICGGGVRYFTNAWVCINMLRKHGCTLPIQLWHLGSREVDAPMTALLSPLQVECVDALKVRKRHPMRLLGGWELKPYAILHSPFRDVLLLDADNVPVRNPEYLFESPEFKNTGAVFWPDYSEGIHASARPVWRSFGLRSGREHEFESGQILVDKQRCWKALSFCLWINSQSDYFYRHLHGDKETFRLAFRKLRQKYALVPHPIETIGGTTMSQHDFQGRRLFQHRNSDKWDFLLWNTLIPDFRYEQECRHFIKELQKRWPGHVEGGPVWRPSRRSTSFPSESPIRIHAVMMTCRKRIELRNQTLAQLRSTDWELRPVQVVEDSSTEADPQRRQTRCARRALMAGLESGAEFILLLEDDLEFNRHFYHNLMHWPPLRERSLTLASLYNPGLPEAANDRDHHLRILHPRSIMGSQCFLMSQKTVEHVLKRWNRAQGMQDLRIARLAGQLNQPVLYHAPSLVQHVGTHSTWGGGFHQARDYSPDWRAPD